MLSLCVDSSNDTEARIHIIKGVFIAAHMHPIEVGERSQAREGSVQLQCEFRPSPDGSVEFACSEMAACEWPWKVMEMKPLVPAWSQNGSGGSDVVLFQSLNV